MSEKLNHPEKSPLILAYNKLLTRKKLTADAKQFEALQRLDKLRSDIIEYCDFNKSKFHSLFRKFLRKPPRKPQGLYIYGGVGRGKSMLMDLFLDSIFLPVKAKRVHFHQFMKYTHKSIHNLREKKEDGDFIEIIAQQISQKNNVLCFDEMQINDVADAMIIGRLFEKLFKNNVIIVITSNRHPDELYKNGLNRELFMPFIRVIKQETQIFHLNSETDYRLQHIDNLEKTYFVPLGEKAEAFAIHAFFEFSGAHEGDAEQIELNNRKIIVPLAHMDVAMFDFKDLCEENLGAEDYLEIAKTYSTVIIKNIPKLEKHDYNQALRFIKLIDTFYEQKVKLLCTAEVEPDEIYVSGEGSFEFQRTASRLHEMRSKKYISKEHIS